LTLDGGEWSTSCSGNFTTGKEPLIPIGQEAGGENKVLVYK